MENNLLLRKSHGSGCCVPGCHNYGRNTKGIHFYSFSTVSHKKPQTEKWIKAIRRVNFDGTPWRPNKGSKICSQHFIGNKKSEHPLSPSFVPSIFPEEYYGKQMKKSTQKLLAKRFERIMKRQIERQLNNLEKQEEEIKLQTNNTITESLVEIKEEPLYSYKINQEIQVDFLEPPNSGPLTFVCNYYVNKRSCDASTQAYIPVIKNYCIVKPLKKTVIEKGCDTRELGPDFAKLNHPVIFKSPDGFLGMPSILCDQELLDLAGLKFDAFHIILNILREAERGYSQKISLANRLLIFFMRIKIELSFSALSILFRVHRTSISRTYQSISHALMINFKDYVKWPKEEKAMLISDFKTILPDLLKSVYAKHKPGCCNL